MKKLDCILLIDDDTVNNFLNQKLLARLDIAEKVIVVNEAEKGLDFLNEFYKENNCHPDFIFIDVNMPYMNGFEFISKFKSTYPHNHEQVRIVMLTAALSRSDRSQLEQAQVAGSIEKPLTKEKLGEILGKYVEGWN